MTAPEWAVEKAAEVLTAHRLGRAADFLRHYPAECACGHVLPPNAGESVESLLAKHQADALRAALDAVWPETTTEVTVRHPDGVSISAANVVPVEASADYIALAEKRWPGCVVVSREVTAWQEVGS